MVYCKPRVFPFGPSLTLSRHECLLRLDTIDASIVESILCSCQLVLLGDKERVTLPLLLVNSLFMVDALLQTRW